MASPATNAPDEGIDRTGLLIGCAVGIPAAVGIGAFMALWRDGFNSTNAALVLMVVVVAVAALGGRVAGIVTALAAMVSFDFFHTRPYLSLTIDSRDDVETTILLLIAGVIVGTLASSGRSARRRAGAASSDIRRIHRVAEAAASGKPVADVIAIAQDELRELLQLKGTRFEALPYAIDTPYPRLSRRGRIEDQPVLRFGRAEHGGGGFELPEEGVEIPVLVRGNEIGRFVLIPTPGVATTLEDRVVAVAIADQLAAVWSPSDTVDHQREI
jgi:Domain of unknown function (DUF4118)